MGIFSAGPRPSAGGLMPFAMRHLSIARNTQISAEFTGRRRGIVGDVALRHAKAQAAARKEGPPMAGKTKKADWSHHSAR